MADLFQEDQAGNILEGLIRIGKIRPDIAEPGGSQQGVHDGMDDDVGIGMAIEAPFKGNLDAAQDQAPPFFQAVDVIARTDALDFPSVAWMPSVRACSWASMSRSR